MRIVKNNEYITLPIAIVLFIASVALGSVGGFYVHGVEVFQKIVIGLVFLLVINALTRLVFKPVFPTLYKYLDQDNREVNGWLAFSPKERSILAFSIFGLYFWAFVQLVSNL